SRASLEARLAWHATPAAPGALSVPQGPVPVAGRNAPVALGRTVRAPVMSAAQRVLLINPTITGKRNARFPLAVLSLRTALEGRHPAFILDGNIDRDFVATAARAVDEGVAAVGVTVMGGPQLTSAIAVSRVVRARAPHVPIIWGGAFPTVCPDATLNSSYVDYAVRGQGEDTLAELLNAHAAGDAAALPAISGLSWRRNGHIVHNRERVFSAASLGRPLPY